MGTKINYYIDNTKSNPPQNWRETSIELNFDKDLQQLQGAQVSITNYDFVNDVNELILKYIEEDHYHLSIIYILCLKNRYYFEYYFGFYF